MGILPPKERQLMSVTVTPRNREYPSYSIPTGATITLVDGGGVQVSDNNGNIVGIISQGDNDIVIS